MNKIADIADITNIANIKYIIKIYIINIVLLHAINSTSFYITNNAKLKHYYNMFLFYKEVIRNNKLAVTYLIIDILYMYIPLFLLIYCFSALVCEIIYPQLRLYLK